MENKREELIEILANEHRHSIFILADRIEALYSPRPYSLDPNSKEYEYKVPEVGGND